MFRASLWSFYASFVVFLIYVVGVAIVFVVVAAKCSEECILHVYGCLSVCFWGISQHC